MFTITPEQRDALLSGDGSSGELDAALRSIRESYDEEGYALVRGLIPRALLDRAQKGGDDLVAASRPGATFTSLDFGAIFQFRDEGDETADKVDGSAFREVAIEGGVPAFIAKVLLDVGNDETLRLLKDAFLAKGKEQKHCGWHVDDIGFWPTDSCSMGVNCWIALDDIPSKYGGGMAVCPKSHVAEWKKKAYATIGSTPLIPPEGLSADPDLLSKFGQTCQMESLNPEMNKMIEASKLEFDYEAGHCLFCNRWLFHRSVEVNVEGLRHYGENFSLKRYTVRYEKGTARLIRGVCLEPAALMDSNNQGKTLDEVSGEVPYYPQCCLDKKRCIDQGNNMKTFAREVLPAVQEKKGQVMKEIAALMKRDAPA